MACSNAPLRAFNPVAYNVKAYVTTCGEGWASLYGGFNLALHVGDEPSSVLANRACLEKTLGAPVAFMDQTHSKEVLTVESKGARDYPCDGLITASPGLYVAVMTADCLPLLIYDCDPEGKAHAVAAVHCGWRGLQRGIVAEAVSRLRALTSHPLYALRGPFITRDSYEVDDKVRDEFKSDPEALTSFTPHGPGHYLFDLNALCSLYLKRLDVTLPSASEEDTLTHPEFYYSYRRAKVTGRMATLIALNV